jgi:hypothetical protein
VRQVAVPLLERGAGVRRLVLRTVDVHLGVREVDDAAGVIDVEVGGDDVAHVGGVEAEAGEVAEDGLGAVQARAGHVEERGAEEPARVVDVGAAETGVDDHQPGRALDDEAVHDQAALAVHHAPRERRAHGRAVDVVDLHRNALSFANSS